MSELLPCPFCGGPVYVEETRPASNGQRFWGVTCRNTLNVGGTCAIEQIPSGSRETAIARWNARALAHIDTLEQTAAERVIADGSRGPTPDYTGEGSAWVPPVEARAVVVPDYETMADLAWRHHFDPLHGPTDMFAAGRTAMYKAMCAELRAIPSDRVLGDGMVGMDRKKIESAASFLEEYASRVPGISAVIAALRANQGGAAT